MGKYKSRSNSPVYFAYNRPLRRGANKNLRLLRIEFLKGAVSADDRVVDIVETLVQLLSRAKDN